MKIAFFVNTYLPNTFGSSVSVEYFRKGLEEIGHEVYIFTPKFHGFELQNEKAFFYPSIMYGYKIKYPLAIPFSPKIDKKIKELDFDIIHTHQPFTVGYQALKNGRKNNIPVVFTYHCRYEDYTHYIPFIQSFVKKYVTSSVKKFANLVDCVIAPTQDIKDILRKQEINTSIEVISTGIDWEKFQNGKREETRSKFGIKDDEVCFWWLGRMEQEKNIEFLLKVIKDFSKRFNNSKFMLVGNGSEMDNIKEFVKEEGLEDKVIITGLVPQKEVQNYYASGDILIQPSKSETQGLVALEAMASGMPVLAITATGTIDIVKDKETGYLLNEDIEEFYQKAQELFKNKELFEKMSQKSREEAFKYDYKNKARRLVEVYDKMIKENRGK
ncbi:MAG: glycosyltransferase [Patescibacteria group bacterium]|jgi:1,2-diacylglycerol 3-alpha-glucosyltransferase|nr:glycosyltransferase [Patescibacteria group bacterium]